METQLKALEKHMKREKTRGSNSPFARLPAELLAVVFSHLDSRDVLSCLLVHSQWYEFCMREPRLWQSIRVSRPRTIGNSATLSILLRRGGSFLSRLDLGRLTLSLRAVGLAMREASCRLTSFAWNAYPANESEESVRSFFFVLFRGDLKELDLSHSTGFDECAMRTLVTCASQRSSLRHLNVSFCRRLYGFSHGLNEDVDKCQSRAVGRKPFAALEELNLSCCEGLSVGDIAALLPLVPRLRVLNLDEVPRLCVALFIEMLPSLGPSLQHLSVRSSLKTTSAEEVQILASLIGEHCCSLVSLNMSDTSNLTTGALELLGCGVVGASLERLQVANCGGRFNGDALQSIAALFPNLRALALDRSANLNSRHFATLLNCCTNLSELSLSNTPWLDDSCILALARSRLALRVLDVSSNANVSSIAWRSLFGSNAILQIEFLNVSHSRGIPSDALETVRKRLRPRALCANFA